jgi:hypothetical protein
MTSAMRASPGSCLTPPFSTGIGKRPSPPADGCVEIIGGKIWPQVGTVSPNAAVLHQALQLHERSNPHPLHFIYRYFAIPPVVERCSARRFMSRHILRDLEAAAVFEIRGDAGGTKRVAAYRRFDAGISSSPAERLRIRKPVAGLEMTHAHRWHGCFPRKLFLRQAPFETPLSKALAEALPALFRVQDHVSSGIDDTRGRRVIG